MGLSRKVTESARDSLSTLLPGFAAGTVTVTGLRTEKPSFSLPGPKLMNQLFLEVSQVHVSELSETRTH